MDKTVPTGAALLLDFIGGIEAPKGYNTVYGNNQYKLKVPVTQMNLGDIVDAQKGWSKNFGSSATGRYQFMRATLIDLSKELHLSGSQVFNGDFQDRLGFHLLKRRGYEAYMSGKINRAEFAKRLAQEWASLPVLQDVQGAHRMLKRGQSYYAGDGLNKSLIAPEKVEQILMLVRQAPDAAPVVVPAAPVVPPAAPAPVPPQAPKAPEPVVVPVAPKKHWLVVVFDTILGWLKR